MMGKDMSRSGKDGQTDGGRAEKGRWVMEVDPHCTNHSPLLSTSRVTKTSVKPAGLLALQMYWPESCCAARGITRVPFTTRCCQGSGARSFDHSILGSGSPVGTSPRVTPWQGVQAGAHGGRSHPIPVAEQCSVAVSPATTVTVGGAVTLGAPGCLCAVSTLTSTRACAEPRALCAVQM